MSIRIAALLLALVSLNVSAEQASGVSKPRKAEVSKPAALGVSIVSKPTMQPIIDALKASGLLMVNTWVTFNYDALGKVTNAELGQQTGSPELDKSILDWVKQVQLSPGSAGTARLPFSLMSDVPEAPQPAAKKP